MRLADLSGLGNATDVETRVCVCAVSSMLCTHTHTQARLHTSCPLVFSEVQPEVLPASQSVLMMVAPSKSQQLLRDLAPRQPSAEVEHGARRALP